MIHVIFVRRCHSGLFLIFMNPKQVYCSSQTNDLNPSCYSPASSSWRLYFTIKLLAKPLGTSGCRSIFCFPVVVEFHKPLRNKCYKGGGGRGSHNLIKCNEGFILLQKRKRLWSSGQSYWLRIQRAGVDSWRYQIFWEVVGLEQGPLSLSTIEELLGRKSSCSGLEYRLNGRRVPSR
jgi:hypothetical protein